ncbi:ABC transporter ATP-binding protein [Priestia megaterium]|uniref:ABC transporter ATP-binding protein n=1 Tax=Priestia megaterium TaxID=1404 RepID=UPI0026E22FA9|nr:ABC transporter ATP-binding protein [Priestia megaterium]MDO6851666.1 ABC transporter ATP-binding protein [Priestia megaterium]
MQDEMIILKKNKKPFKTFIHSQIYFLKLIIKEHPKNAILFAFITLLSSVSPPLVVLLNKKTIDKISSINGDITAFKTVIGLLILYYLLNYAIEVFRQAQDYIFEKISLTINFVLKGMISEKLIMTPLKKFEDSFFYDSIKLANISLSGSGIKVVQNVISIIGSLISLVGIFGILISIHWSLPFALFLSTLPGIILIFASKMKSYHMERELSPIEREMSFTESLFIDKRSLREIKIYNTGEFLLNKWRHLFEGTAERKLKLALFELKSKSLAVFILQISSLTVSVFLVFQIFGGELSIGSYIALITAVMTVQGLFGSIGGDLGNIFETAMYNEALLNILNYQEEKTETQLIPVNRVESISLKNASFYYPNSNEKVLDNISLNISKGDNISIVGYNGSGKTTLAYCLLGLFELNEGSLKVNDVDINDIDKSLYLSRVSAVFQDFMRYKYTVRENIGMGNLNKINNDGKIYESLKKVGMHKKIENYSKGLETFLTKELPEGSELSGGEWQRIALARAFLKDADLIVLDEPTAALDPISELQVFDIFHELSSKKTTLTISHRIGPTKRSDLIVVMDRGKIVEQGSFDELIDKKGMFYKMYESQSLWYKDELLISKGLETITT